MSDATPEPVRQHGPMRAFDQSKPLTPQQVADRVEAYLSAKIPVSDGTRIGTASRAATLTEAHTFVVHPAVFEDIELGLPRGRASQPWHRRIIDRAPLTPNPSRWPDLLVCGVRLDWDSSLTCDALVLRLDTVVPGA